MTNKLLEEMKALTSAADVIRHKMIPAVEREQRKWKDLGFETHPLNSVMAGINLPTEGGSDIDLNLGSHEPHLTSKKIEELGVPLSEKRYDGYIHAYKSPEGFDVELKVRPKHEVDYQLKGWKNLTSIPEEERMRIIHEKHRLKSSGDEKGYKEYKSKIYEQYGMVPPGGDWASISPKEKDKMSSIQYSAFFEELEKLAYGPEAQAKSLAAAKKRQLPKRASELTEGAMASVAPPEIDMKEQKEAFKGLSRHYPTVEEVKKLHADEGRGMINQIKAPVILGSVRDTLKAARKAGAPLPYIKPENMKTMNAVLKGHELDEIHTKPSLGSQPDGHKSPDVIFREHNRLVTLPPGNDDIIDLHKFIRGGNETSYFPRGITYGEGSRLSRHARRRLTEAVANKTRDILTRHRIYEPSPPISKTSSATFPRYILGVEKLAFGPEDQAKVLSLAKKRQFSKGVTRAVREKNPKAIRGLQILNTPQEIMDRNKSTLSGIPNYPPPSKGKIQNALDSSGMGFMGRMNRGGIIGSVKNALELAKSIDGVSVPKFTPEQHKTLHSVFKGHELDELTTKPALGTAQFGHVSPDVIFKEHNRLVTLPEGNEEVKDFMKSIRNQKNGEHSLFPSGMIYGKSPRMSRHARRRLTELASEKIKNRLIDLFSRYDSKHEKTAAGPTVTYMDHLGPSATGFYLPQEQIYKSTEHPDPLVREDAINLLRKTNKSGLIGLPTSESLRSSPALQSSLRILPEWKRGGVRRELEKGLRGHEMTHYMRDKKGLMPELGPIQRGIKPGLQIAREELAANLSALKRMRGPREFSGPAKGGLIASIPENVYRSVKAHYPEGVLKGTIGHSIREAAGRLFGKK